ncbi:M56 family metallopeptidase [Streptomyces tagetis]|uniref:M56 family metallopeptidase n=1 Tax=Streptomyces tagetis TaxID=2820809 RepID=A0A941B157_9ACTN|nr:M56 family metallopeptidase [Streptomyces sp. RG38]MBQ0828100.1 M56 family metallopeptidase [Streptomyces sp. RG38]
MSVCLLPPAALALAATLWAPSALSRSRWPAREPVLGLWAWQCLTATALLSYLCALLISAAPVVEATRAGPAGPGSPVLTAARDLAVTRPWAAALTLLLASGAGWTAACLARELVHAWRHRGARRTHLRERAPDLPTTLPAARGPVLVLEDEYPDAWLTPSFPPQLAVTTGALRKLTERQLEAVLTHELVHARARHNWLLHLSTALATGFPRVPLFAHFCDQTHRLVELAADDTAARRCGHRTTALALIELNRHRGVPTRAVSRPLLSQRLERLLHPPDRLPLRRRAATSLAVGLAPLLFLSIALTLMTAGPG